MNLSCPIHPSFQRNFVCRAAKCRHLLDTSHRLYNMRELVLDIHLLRNTGLEVSGIFQGVRHQNSHTPRHFHVDSQRLREKWTRRRWSVPMDTIDYTRNVLSRESTERYTHDGMAARQHINCSTRVVKKNYRYHINISIYTPEHTPTVDLRERKYIRSMYEYTPGIYFTIAFNTWDIPARRRFRRSGV